MKTDSQIAAMGVVKAVGEAIQEMGEVPSGHLYAHLMGHMSYSTYCAIINLLEAMGKITRNGHLLRWAQN